MVAFWKLKRGGGGQICEQGSFKGAGLIHLQHTANYRGIWGHAPPGNFWKKGILWDQILVHFWPCITCIILHQYQVLYIYIYYIYIWKFGRAKDYQGGGGQMPPFPPPPPKSNPVMSNIDVSASLVTKFLVRHIFTGGRPKMGKILLQQDSGRLLLTLNWCSLYVILLNTFVVQAN